MGRLAWQKACAAAIASRGAHPHLAVARDGRKGRRAVAEGVAGARAWEQQRRERVVGRASQQLAKGV